ncbi:unnamed protein product [Larinioides sclopetarius]|uniref:Uncharacterized protein n=1 Tax=Larinioides sclopetarius TaxID=280406 RepID=A0AAV2B198_9ARAC
MKHLVDWKVSTLRWELEDDQKDRFPKMKGKKRKK